MTQTPRSSAKPAPTAAHIVTRFQTDTAAHWQAWREPWHFGDPYATADTEANAVLSLHRQERAALLLPQTPERKSTRA